MAWTCPECRRSFGRTNQSHGCAPSTTLEGYFDSRPPIQRTIFDRIAKHIATLDDAHVDPVFACVMFKRARTFAEVRSKRDRLVLCFLVSRLIVDPRIAKTLPLSARRTEHFVELVAPKDVDKTVRAWLTEAYASSPP